MDVALDALGKHFEHPAARPRGVHRRRGHGAPRARRVAVFGREVAPDAVAHHGVDQVVQGALNICTRPMRWPTGWTGWRCGPGP